MRFILLSCIIIAVYDSGQILREFSAGRNVYHYKDSSCDNDTLFIDSSTWKTARMNLFFLAILLALTLSVRSEPYKPDNMT